MKKKLTLLLSILSMSTLYSQSQKVGINTDDPKQTLDVNGTVRLQTPGEYTSDSKLLGIVEDTGEVVTMDNTIGDPFIVRRMKISHNPTDLKNNIIADLGYATNRYEVALLSARFVDDVTGKPPYMKFYSVIDKNYYNDDGYSIATGTDPHKVDGMIGGLRLFYRAAGINHSFFASDYKQHIIQGNLQEHSLERPQNDSGQFNSILYAVPKYEIIEKSGKWHFKGGYDYAYSLGENSKSWIIEFIVIDKNWVKRKPKDKMPVYEVNKNDNKTITLIKGEAPLVD